MMSLGSKAELSKDFSWALEKLLGYGLQPGKGGLSMQGAWNDP